MKREPKSAEAEPKVESKVEPKTVPMRHYTGAEMQVAEADVPAHERMGWTQVKE